MRQQHCRHVSQTATEISLSVPELQRALVQLTNDSRKLEEDSEKLKQLSDNVVALVREKERLDAKSSMHDNLAACITLTKQYIIGEFDGIEADVVCREWEKAITFRGAIGLSAKEKLLDSAKAGGVTVRIREKEPTDGGAEMMYTAMQVCLTNAIQHANATEISVNIWENEYSYTVMIRPSSQADMAGQW